MDNQSAITQDFEKNWSIITDAFKEQKEKGLFPFSYSSSSEGEQLITEESFQKTLDTLHDEKFTIAVCGVVKAGKSTFLNSLLFGNDILPAFDTPMTAKLTFIEYTDKANYATITFYSKEEWAQLNDDLKEKFPEQSKELQERMKLCSEKYGVAMHLYIGRPDIEIKDLNQIEEYVTDPKTKGGKYTPYVKCVHIYIRNESIKNLRIVDTPGLNDPNIINSLETEKWIRNTHALIFLLQNKGMTENDLQFFEVHLSNTSAGNRLFVINKIDDLDVDEWIKTRSYLKERGKTEAFIKRGHLFGDNETICGYSALLSMLKNMRDKGIPLNEDQEWSLAKGEDDGVNPDPDNIAEKLSAKLYSNTGIKRIASGVNLILQVYSTHVKQLERTILESKNTLLDCGKSMEELGQETKELELFQKKLMNTASQYKEDVNDIVSKILAEGLVRPAERSLDKIDMKIQAEIQACNNAEGLRNLSFTIKEECEKQFGTFGTFKTSITQAKREIREELAQTSALINRDFSRRSIVADIDCSELSEIHFEDFDFDSISEEIAYQLSAELPSSWFEELFTKKDSMREIARKGFLKAKATIREQLDSRTRSVRKNIMDQVQNNFNDLIEQIQNICLNKKKMIETNKNDRENIKKQSQMNLDNATQRQNEIIEIRRSFELHLPQQVKNIL
jgi:hypothetical protein